MRNIVFQALAAAACSGEPVALGVITGVKGSSPQKVGAKALFYADGRIKGTLGGGCLEAEIQQRAVQSLSTGRAAMFDVLLDHDFGWDDGLICGGKVCGLILPNAQKAGVEFWRELTERSKTVMWGVDGNFDIARVHGRESFDRPQGLGPREPAGPLGPMEGADELQAAGAPEDVAGDWLYKETVTAPCTLWIAGAGHIAQAVAPLALQLDFRVTVFDDRPAMVNHQFFPLEVSLQADVWDKLLALPLPSAPSFGLIVTRGHRHDALVLKEWIHRPFLFLGMIGSSRKARTIFEHFTEEKLATADELQCVACPVGIKIRAQSVQEIAVSIMAQFIDKRAGLVYDKQGTAAAKFELLESR
jgi:xanthine dehydrogenase accessory factor